MEGLFELVAASFLRHGIECPADSRSTWRQALPVPSKDPVAFVSEPALPAELPDHNFRKQPVNDLARQA